MKKYFSWPNSDTEFIALTSVIVLLIIAGLWCFAIYAGA